MTKAQVFRPISNLVLAATALLLLGLLVVATALDGQLHATFKTLLLAGATGILVWLIFVRPKIEVYDDRVRVTNPLQTALFGFGIIDGVNTKYFLVIKARDRKVKAWVAPTPTRYASRGVRATDLKGMYLTPMPGVRDTDQLSLRAGDSPKAHSGQAAAILRIAMESDLKRANTEFKVQTHWVPLALAAAAAIVGLLI